MYKSFAIVAALSLPLCFNANASELNTIVKVYSGGKHIASFPECLDIHNRRVSYVSENKKPPSSPSVVSAAARYENFPQITNPVIYFDYKFLKSLPPVGKQFIQAHECHHLKSGSALLAYKIYTQYRSAKGAKKLKLIEKSKQLKIQYELAADCYAAQEVGRRGYSLKSLKEYLIHLPSLRRISDEGRRKNAIECYLENKRLDTVKAAMN